MTQPMSDRNSMNHSNLRAIRSIASESYAPFTVIPNAKIPDMSESRKEERTMRAEGLLRRPKHKEHKNAANNSQ